MCSGHTICSNVNGDNDVQNMSGPDPISAMHSSTIINPHSHTLGEVQMRVVSMVRWVCRHPSSVQRRNGTGSFTVDIVHALGNNGMRYHVNVQEAGR